MEQSVAYRTPAGAASWTNSRRASVFLLILLVAGLGLALTLQGWRSRVPAFDLLTYIYSARDFLATGALPEHGDTGSYGSFKPAGTAWLMLPGMVLFDDPRLPQYVGAGILHLATVAGLYILGRHYFNRWCAYLAVVLYGLSHHGLFLAGSLWPNGRPDFYVWIVVFTTLWVDRREARFLAAACAVWGIGMQVDMGITPAIMILPLAWLYFRPPVRIRPLLAGGFIGLAVWMPYLRFELDRGFIDLRSQILLQSIFPADNYRSAWCEPDVALSQIEPPLGIEASSTYAPVYDRQAASAAQALQRMGGSLWKKALSNYEPVAPIPGASEGLLFLTLISAVSLAASRGNVFIPRRYWRSWYFPLALAMIMAALLVNEVFVARYLSPDGILGSGTITKLHRLQTLGLMGGGLILLEGFLIQFPIKSWFPHQEEKPSSEEGRSPRLLGLSLAIPWIILLIVAEPGKPERFWWLWPLQILFLSAAVSVLIPRLGISRGPARIIAGAIILAIVVNPFMQGRVSSWLQDGWSGRDADQVQVVEFVADRILEKGSDHEAIGYQIYIYHFMAAYNLINPQYKAGAEFDLLFAEMGGITNTNQCAEGLSPMDSARIVQLRPELDPAAPRMYFESTIPRGLQLVKRIGDYEVYIRE